MAGASPPLPSLVEALAALFSGLDRAHGEFRIAGKGPKGKVIGQGVTVKSPPTTELWEKHISGEQGLGIVPIKADATCSWAAIDIDDHGLDLVVLNNRAKALKLPLVLARSKSGGAHGFLFLKEPLPCSVIREHLMTWAAWLGYGGCEVFPKQIKLADSGDVGNWLNMPYFEHEMTMRYAIDPNGSALSLKKFLVYANKMKQTGDQLASIEGPQSDKLPEAPPCLQAIAAQGVPQGMRNETLFSFGVYMKMAHEDDWEDHLEDINIEVFDPPLKSREMQTVVKSLGRKDYFYRCEEPPLRQLCNKTLCKKMKYGIGGGGCEVNVTGLMRIDTRPPVWYAEVEGQRIRMESADLMQQNRFAMRCMEDIGMFPSPKKPHEWRRLLNGLMETMEIVEVPAEAGPEGLLWDHVWAFLEASGSQAKRKEDLAYHHKVWREDGYIWFRSAGLVDWLKRHRFTELTPNKIWAVLKTHPDHKHHQFSLGGKCVQCWGLPEDTSHN